MIGAAEPAKKQALVHGIQVAYVESGPRRPDRLPARQPDLLVLPAQRVAAPPGAGRCLAPDLLEHAPRPGGCHYEIPTGPGLGVGEFRTEVAKAHPFDPKAFLLMWSDDWRKRF